MPLGALIPVLTAIRHPPSVYRPLACTLSTGG